VLLSTAPAGEERIKTLINKNKNPKVVISIMATFAIRSMSLATSATLPTTIDLHVISAAQTLNQPGGQTKLAFPSLSLTFCLFSQRELLSTFYRAAAAAHPDHFIFLFSPFHRYHVSISAHTRYINRVFLTSVPMF
jgi:hypothetical protein